MKSPEDKLRSFEKTVMKQAYRERDALEDAFAGKMKAALSEAEVRYQKEAQLQYCRTLEETKKEARLTVSAAKNQGQTALSQKRNEIMAEVFDKLEERLRAYTKTPAYKVFLNQKLIQAMGSGPYRSGPVIVILAKEDAETERGRAVGLAARYLPGISVQVESSTEDIIGGCQLRIPSAGRIIDNSIRAMMDAERVQFLSWSQLAVSQEDDRYESH